MHHNFVRWSADELAGGPKQWFCIDNAAEARQNLLKAKWWRATQFQEGSTFNDTAVLQFYENNSMTLGSKKI